MLVSTASTADAWYQTACVPTIHTSVISPMTCMLVGPVLPLASLTALENKQYTSLCHCLQSTRSSSSALRAQDSSDPAFDKHHTDPASHNQASPHSSSPHPDPGTDEAPLFASAEQDTQPSTDDGQSHNPAADQNRQSQDGSQEEGAGFTAADEAAHADADGRTAHLASLAEQADIRQVLSNTGLQTQ